MSKINAGAQPTNKVDNSQKAKDVKHGELYGKLAQHYTLHYLSRRLQDIPNPRKTFKTNPTLFENKIKRYKNKYCGDHHSHSFDDLRQAAQLMVHECAINFVKDKKEFNGQGEKNKKFDFCKLASKYLDFRLKNYIYHLNTKRLNGSLPDSDVTRKLYYQLTKWKSKFEIKSDERLGEKHYEEISNFTGIDKKKIRKIDTSLTEVVVPGDKKIGEDNSDTIFDLVPNWSNCPEKEYDYKILLENIKKYLKSLPSKDREILIATKLPQLNSNKDCTLSELGKKYNLTLQRIQQIRQHALEGLQIKLRKNLKY